MKESDQVIFTKEEFDYFIDHLPKSPMELAVVAHTKLTEGKLSVKEDQMYTIVLQASKDIIKRMPDQIKVAFPELFQ